MKKHIVILIAPKDNSIKYKIRPPPSKNLYLVLYIQKKWSINYCHLEENRYSLKNDSRRKDLNLHTELAFLILTFKEQIILRLDCLSLVMP